MMTSEPDPTVEDLLREGAARLRVAGIDGARLDARVLLAGLLGRDSNSLLPGDMSPVPAGVVQRYDDWLERRKRREPVSRILGRREFFGRDFEVTPDTLDPRADTEALVELALELGPVTGRIADLGTGTGCILLTLLAERPGLNGIGIDRSLEALEVARRNADALGLSARAELLAGDWLRGSLGCFDLIVSNPPYIPDADIPGLMPDVRDHDPHLALAGGADGMDAYRAIFGDARDALGPRGIVAVEIGAGQKEPVVEIARGAGLGIRGERCDLGGHVRALAFTKG